jgi:hypothetical protein
MSTDYLPRPDRKFLAWVNNMLQYLMARLAKFKFPQEDYDRLDQKRNVYAQKLDVAEAPATHTPINVEEKNDAREELETDVRKCVGEYLIKNHLLTKGDLKLLGLPVHKTTRAPIPPPTDAVALAIRQLSGHRVEVNFSRISIDDADKAHRAAKPFGVHGVEIRWMISDTPILDAEDLTHSSFDTRTPLILEFRGHERGQILYICARWENTTGQKGPWSDIESAVIP